MKIGWTPSQKQRLRELNASPETDDMVFASQLERNKTFLDIEHSLAKESQLELKAFLRSRRRPRLCVLEEKLSHFLVQAGFVQVTTPLIISRSSLEKMSIEKHTPLYEQVFWIGKTKCLRPMLAPNLYSFLNKLIGLWEKPIRIFEVGPCFRKDTGGKYHLNEFTMLNLVELGLPKKKGEQRLKEIAFQMMEVAGIEEYEFAVRKSEVYGTTIDIISGIELASGALGPHPLDARWGIVDPWVGIGFGLERLLMKRENFRNIQRVGRTLSYLDGVRLNI